jgi:hypothetical protein
MSPSGSGLRLSALQTALLVAAVLACRAAAIQACPTYDDAFITYRYAENLAAGHGLVFNPGAPWEPVLGTTTLLYALLMAGCASLGLDLVHASLGLNLACDAASAVLLVHLLGRRPVVATAAVLGFAGLPELARISVGGMESPVFLLLALAACRASQAGRPALAGALTAATCLTRPEGVLLAGILAAPLVRRPRDLARYAAPVVAVGLVAILALVAVYGTPIPQSVTAKSAMQGPDVEAEKAARLAMILREAFLPRGAYVVGLPFAALGLVRALRQGVALRAFSLYALAIVAAYVAARPHTWGWYYYVPLAALVTWIALGLESAWSWIAARARPALALAVDSFAPQAASVAIGATALAVGARLESPIEARVYAPLWAWAAETSAAEPGARILASDIGAIGRAWRGTVLDSEGLVWPAAVGLREPLAIVALERPEYLLVVAERPRLRHLAQGPAVMAQYEPIRRFNATGDTRLDLAPEDVPLAWSQDYLVYRRRE